MLAGDEQSVGWRQVLLDWAGRESAVQNDLAWAQAELVEASARLLKQLVLVGRPDLGGDREDEAAGAAAGVLA